MKYECTKCQFVTDDKRKFACHKGNHTSTIICPYCKITIVNGAHQHITSCGKNPDSPYRDGLVFVEKSTMDRGNVKKRILQRLLIEYKCAVCGIEPVWQGKPMPLILDHINGVNNDNRILNLRFVCSNCDSQLPTYKSKNNGRLTGKVPESP
jgi:hypothetical protein